jgi:lipopolysaccharide export system ATP-binding protein
MTEENKLVYSKAKKAAKLSAIKIRKSFKRNTVVKDVSLSLSSGEVVGLLGPNGAGKTTCFYILVGLLFPDSGKIYLDDMDLTEQPLHKRAKIGIGYLPQNESIFRKLTVKNNLLLIMEIVKVPRNKRKYLLESLLEKFNIGYAANTNGAALSGGERRRVELARSLIINPKFLLLDEPFAGVDPVTVQEVQAIIKRLKDDEGMGILVTDHNVRETLGICDRAYVVSKGELLAHGRPAEIADLQIVRETYLGRNFSLK